MREINLDRDSPYKPDSRFSYKGEYSVETDNEITRVDDRLRQHYRLAVDEFTPRDALVKWVRSHPGGWQNDQTARYPTFHRDLDQNLLPSNYDTDEKAEAFRLEMLERLSAPPRKQAKTSTRLGIWRGF